MPYVSAAVAASFRSSQNVGWFWRIDSDPPGRLWLGSAPIDAGITAVDPVGGATYLGAGVLQNLPELDALINGISQRVDFFLSGIPSDFPLVLDDMPEVKGAIVHVGMAKLDAEFQLTTAIIPLWRGKADYWAVQQKAVFGPNETPTKTLIVSVGGGNTKRSRGTRVAWSAPQQRAISPTDAFCDRVSRYTARYEVTWPRA